MKAFKKLGLLAMAALLAISVIAQTAEGNTMKPRAKTTPKSKGKAAPSKMGTTTSKSAGGSKPKAAPKPAN